MSKTYLLLAIFGLLFFSSCKKELNPRESPEKTAFSQSPFVTNDFSDDCDGPSNPDNSWDSVGVYHNLALDYVYQHKSDTTNTFANRLTHANQYVLNAFNSRVSNLSSKLFSSSSMSSLLSDSSNSFSNLIDNSSYSKGVKDRFKQLISLIKDTASLSSMDYCFIKGIITDFEAEVMRDGTLSSSEVDQILKVTSVARYSLYYWYGHYSATLTGNENIYQKHRSFWQWLVIGVCDVAGGIAGGAAGSATVVGAVAGAVAGAAGASGSVASLVD